MNWITQNSRSFRNRRTNRYGNRRLGQKRTEPQRKRRIKFDGRPYAFEMFRDYDKEEEESDKSDFEEAAAEVRFQSLAKAIDEQEEKEKKAGFGPKRERNPSPDPDLPSSSRRRGVPSSSQKGGPATSTQRSSSSSASPFASPKTPIQSPKTPSPIGFVRGMKTPKVASQIRRGIFPKLFEDDDDTPRSATYPSAGFSGGFSPLFQDEECW